LKTNFSQKPTFKLAFVKNAFVRVDTDSAAEDYFENQCSFGNAAVEETAKLTLQSLLLIIYVDWCNTRSNAFC